MIDITGEQDFHKNGWAIIDTEIPSNTLDEVAEETEKIKDVDRSLVNGYQNSKAIERIASFNIVTEFIESGFGRKCFPFQTINFPSGSKQSLHQDSVHFQSYPTGLMCAAWVALEDISIKSGPLHIAKNSKHIPTYQKFELAELNSKFRNDVDLSYKVYEEALEKLVLSLNLDVEPVIIKKGQALIWDTRLIHGGASIETEKLTRLSQVTHYFFEDCLYYAPLQSDMLNGNVRYILPYDISKGKRVPISSLISAAKKNNISIVFVLMSLLKSFISNLLK